MVYGRTMRRRRANSQNIVAFVPFAPSALFNSPNRSLKISFLHSRHTIHNMTTALSLYRAMLREAKQVSDYNFRSYSIRRVKGGFRKNQHLQGYVCQVFCDLVDDSMKDSEASRIKHLTRLEIVVDRDVTCSSSGGVQYVTLLPCR